MVVNDITIHKDTEKSNWIKMLKARISGRERESG